MTTPGARRAASPTRTTSPLSKVPEATAAFWVIKILTTGTGETASDFIGNSAVPLAAALKDRGGLGWGTGPVTLVLSVVILALVGWLTLTGRDAIESMDVELPPTSPASSSDGPATAG